MIDTLLDAFLDLLSSIYLFEAGSAEFYVMLGATCGGAVFAGRVLLSMFKSDKGFFGVFVVFGLSTILGLLGHVLVQEYGLPYIKADWAELYLPWSIAAIIMIVVVSLLGRRFLDLGAFISLVIVCVSIFIGIVSYYLTERVIEIFDFGSEQVERNQPNTREIFE